MEAIWVPGTMEENSAVGVMPSPLLSLVESITPILNRGPRTMHAGMGGPGPEVGESFQDSTQHHGVVQVAVASVLVPSAR